MVDDSYFYRRDIQDYPDMDDSSDSDHDFDVLEDLDTVMYWRVNSFFHSISNEQLMLDNYLDDAKVNETVQLANTEQAEYAQGKINYYFH